LNVRIIPRLDIKGPNLVKGVHLEGLRVLGSPEDFARFYYTQGADELIYQDAVASLYERNSLKEIIERTSKEIFIPLTVGGGLRTVEDIREVLRAGADKVAINTAVVGRPELIKEASRAFGSSTVIVSIEAIKNPDGTYEACVDYGRQRTGIDVFDWALQVAEMGAGELLVTSIDREGTGKGYDLELNKQIAESVGIPVIACGGAGNLEHFREVIEIGKADAVSAASVFHYNFIRQREYTDDQARTEGNVEFLLGERRTGGFGKIQDATLQQTKDYLTNSGIECRTMPI